MTYAARVRELPCCSCGRAGPSHCHHLTGAGMGLRSSDLDSMPLCQDCHTCLHEFRGPFAGMNRKKREQWQVDRIFETRRLLGVEPGAVGERAAPKQGRKLPVGRKLPIGRKIPSRPLRRP